MSDFEFWEGLWTANGGLKPGEYFDIFTPCPALVSLVESGQLPTPKALVPGCGRGYDVTYLAKSGRYRKVVGIDLARSALQAARKRLEELDESERPADGIVEFLEGDFFNHSFGEEKFNFIYDYTFLCAIPPSVRGLWARRMHELLSDDGELVTLVFPIYKDTSTVDPNSGPPYAMTFELVKSLLEPAGFVLKSFELLPPELSHPGRDGSRGKVSGLGRWRKAHIN